MLLCYLLMCVTHTTTEFFFFWFVFNRQTTGFVCSWVFLLKAQNFESSGYTWQGPPICVTPHTGNNTLSIILSSCSVTTHLTATAYKGVYIPGQNHAEA